ncbi:transthyretin isoform X2 [Echeneis naucrates]|uniref:transthyretin isoform X2 n=1 Tax=Echeneis naucrates TaxID=173247 RepID=UPI00111407DE|nr:transthyretin-like isoform X2 [Echeneis naucrates]
MLQPLPCLLLASAVLLGHTAPTVSGKHGGSDTKCPLMVKILDAVKGTPAGSVPLRVSQKAADGGWTQIANGVTDDTGEIHDLITEEQFAAGVYRVEFDIKAYWKNEGSTPFHEIADVVFEAHAEGHRHYTLALLLSPYSFTTTAIVTDAHQ